MGEALLHTKSGRSQAARRIRCPKNAARAADLTFIERGFNGHKHGGSGTSSRPRDAAAGDRQGGCGGSADCGTAGSSGADGGAGLEPSGEGTRGVEGSSVAVEPALIGVDQGFA